MKKGKKIVIIVLATLALLTIVGIFVLNAFISTDKFKDILTGMMEKQLQAKVNIDQWEASIFSGVQFTNLSVDQPAGFGTGKLLKTDKFVIKFDFLNLLKKKITFSKIIIDNLDVNINQNKEGLWFFQSTSDIDEPYEQREGFEKQKKSDESSAQYSNLVILAETIRIKNANFLAKDLNGDVVGELKDANIDGNINIDGTRNDVILSLNSPSIALSNMITGIGSDISVKNLEADIKADRNKAQLRNLSFEIFNGNVQVEMVALNYQDDQPDVGVDIQISNLDFAPVLAMLDQPTDMIASPVTCKISSKMKLESLESLNESIEKVQIDQVFNKFDKNTLPALCKLLDNINVFEANINLDKTHLKNISGIENIIVNSANFPIRINKREIVLDKYDIGIWGGKLLTSLDLKIDLDSVGLKADIKTENINSVSFTEIAGLEKDFLNGLLNSHLTVEGSIRNFNAFTLDTIDNVSIDGTVSLGEIFVKPAGKIDVLNMSYKLSDGKIMISPLSVKAYGGEALVTLNADKPLSAKPVFDTNISVKNLDGTTLMKLIDQDPDLLSGDLNLNLMLKGSGKSLDSLYLDSYMEIGPITLMKDSYIDRIKIPIRIEDGKLNIQPNIKAFQGELKSTLNAYDIADFQTETSTSLPKFEIEATIVNMDSRMLLESAKMDATMLSGPVNLILNVSGKGNSMENLDANARFYVPAINVETVGALVENVNGELQFANQKATIKDFNAEIFDGSTSVQGTFDLQDETYNADVKLESLDVAKAMEGFAKEISYIKYFLDTTNMMTGTATGVAKATGSLENSELIKGTFDFNIDNGLISGHPIQEGLSEILDIEELENVRFSQINTTGSIDGLLVNLDNLDLKSESVALSSSDGMVDMENDILVMPIEIGLSPEIADKLNKPVKEIRYGLTERDDGLHYLPSFNITGSVSNPDIKKALVEVLLKSAATGFLRKEIFKSLGKEKEGDSEEELDVGEVGEEEKEEKEGVENLIGDVLDGIFGGKKKKEEVEEEADDKSEKKKGAEDFIKDILGF